MLTEGFEIQSRASLGVSGAGFGTGGYGVEVMTLAAEFRAT